MDRLVTKNQEVMYKLVDYANRAKSKLVLIGIANSLNLPDKFLLRLKGKNVEPKRLSFNPYTTDDIIEIISARLQSLDPQSSTLPMMDPKAIELCARKVSAASGDLRTALDMCRKAIELVETEHLKSLENAAKRPLQENTLQTPSPSPAKRRRTAAVANASELDASSAPKVTLTHIMNLTKTGSNQSFQSRLKGLPPHHKAILCTLVVLKSSSAPPTIGDTCDKYTKLCRRDGMLDPLSRGEFLDACKQLDANDIITIEKPKKKIADRAKSVGLNIQDVDVLQAIAGMEMLTRFFEE
jgi:cell division control protein 6